MSVADNVSQNANLYSLEEINDLDWTFDKSVNVKDFFPNAEKIIRPVSRLQNILLLGWTYCMKRNVSI